MQKEECEREGRITIIKICTAGVPDDKPPPITKTTTTAAKNDLLHTNKHTYTHRALKQALCVRVTFDGSSRGSGSGVSLCVSTLINLFKWQQMAATKGNAFNCKLINVQNTPATTTTTSSTFVVTKC